ncbi:MAG TPA: hypothetical protein VJB99_00620 [Patescibacteria group bacterium]|nr:hypothetical protein [Patescibacteria group bacterium]
MEQNALQDILEIVTFLKDNAVSREEAVTKEELHQVKQELRSEMVGMKDELRSEMVGMENRLLTHIDGFVKLHTTLEVEQLALRAKCERLEDRDDQLAKHLQFKFS